MDFSSVSPKTVLSILGKTMDSFGIALYGAMTKPVGKGFEISFHHSNSERGKNYQFCHCERSGAICQLTGRGFQTPFHHSNRLLHFVRNDKARRQRLLNILSLFQQRTR